VTTRSFGWGLPSTVIAPISDSFNHLGTSPNTMDIINKVLHLKAFKKRPESEPILMAYNYTLDWSDYDITKMTKVKEESSKLRFEVKDLYKS
jgi:hypothetical protein